MGNWRNRRRWLRPPKSYYYPDHDPDPQPPSHQEYVDDGVPMWEKEFCNDVGAVPWHRVVDAKKFSYGQSQILKWDDSAGEEAFHNAKNRYWALINGLPCDIPRPDPDACIDKIDWDPYIDPKLVRELEQEYFAPVEDESYNGRRKKKTRNVYSDPPESHSINPTDAANPWGTQNLVQSGLTAVTMESPGWGDQWDDNNKLKESNYLNTGDDPWEKACHPGDEVMKGSTAWPVGGDDSWGWNSKSVHVTESKDWASGGNTWDDGKATVWEDFREHPRKWNHSGHSQEGSWRNNSSSKSRGTKRWDGQAGGTKTTDSRKPNGGWGAWNKDSWRNESESARHQQNAGYQTSGLEGSDYRAGGHHWRSGSAKKRVSFGY